MRLTGPYWGGGEAMSIFDRAKSVLNLLARHLGQRPIVFVCHSLGGLVVTAMLREAVDAVDPQWQAIGKQTRGLVFIATPHKGADLARVVKRLALVTQPTPVMADLNAHEPAVLSLNDWLKRYVHRSEISC
jgi:predicted alpha/beta hydrolase family esterase